MGAVVPRAAMASTLTLLAACSPPAPATPAPVVTAAIPAPRQLPVEVSDWACGDAAHLTMLTARFYAAPDRVELAFNDGGKQTLAASGSMAGALYERDGFSFQTKDDQALLTSGEGTSVCRRVAKE